MAEDRDARHTPQSGGALIAVYESPATASRVAEDVRGLGVPPAAVHVDEAADDRASLVAEMQEETGRAFVSPTVGVAYPKEAKRSMVLIGLPFLVGGTLLGLIAGFWQWGGLPLWARLLLGGAVGATFGGTVAIVMGPAMGAKRSDEPLAAQRGTTVRVEADSPEVVAALAAADPIRLDRQVGDHFEVVGTEDLAGGSGIVDEIKRNADNPRMENLPGDRGNQNMPGRPD